MNKVKTLLLAAGLGTRLRSLTNNWPKCLMPIGNRPLLEYWLETLYTTNVSEVLVNLHHHSEIVQGFLNRPRFKNWVNTVYEETLLGTAGTLKGNKEYFVSQGEKLEGIYELIEVNQNEIIFRENEKLYRINNLVGK